MKLPFILSTVALLLPFNIASAQEKPVESKIESVDLFKNGLALVKRTVQVPEGGTYRVEDVPSPVHGTFWTSCPVPLKTRVTTRLVESPARNVGVDWQNEFTGKEVNIRFRDGTAPPIGGVVVEVARPSGSDAWNRQYEQTNRYGYYAGAGMPPMSGQFLILDTGKGRAYVDLSTVATIEIQDAGNVVKRRTPVLLLTVEPSDKDKGPFTISISYLTKGIAWAPSYRVNLDDSKTLTIEQQAAIKNEMEDFSDVEVRLISGFPSVRFAHVLSPLSLETNWANFFAQLNQEPQSPRGAIGNSMAQQRVADNTVSDADIDLSAMPSGEGVDLHYQSIGKCTMNEGDALATSVAKGTAPYERIVEWIVPDTRAANGRYIEEYQRQQEPEKYQDAAWDSVRFKNPLPFAMTTGPAMITANGQFNGQQMSYWVNSGEQTTLHITKALSLRTRATEQEEQGQERDLVYIGGNDFRKVNVSGELVVNNHRKEPIKLIIRRQFSGELTSADAEPKVVLREEGVYSVNRRNELTWNMDLQPGEEKTLKYKYWVLVDN